MRSRAQTSGLLERLTAIVAPIALAVSGLPLVSPPPAVGAQPTAAACQDGFLASAAPSVEDCPSEAEGGVAAASNVAAGFEEVTVWSGLQNPTAIRFAADGRVFVIEKAGRIKVFSSLIDPSPTTYAGLLDSVHNYWDRGLLGLALDPSLTGGSGSGPYVYVAYSYDHILGSGTPAPQWTDLCPNPPGGVTDGCVISGRVSRFAVSGTSITGAEEVLLEDWCQQFPSHSVGSLAFGPDGSLYVSGGDGASFTGVDYGQRGGTTNPIVTGKNPCGDPPADSMTPPTAEGGALRSQDIRTTSDATGLNGAILRVDPDTGASVAGSPFAGSSDANARRIIAHGLRNPFRITFRPGTSELWFGDVGWDSWEEIDRIPNALDATAENFGWPCYEGGATQTSYNAADLDLCEDLYDLGAGAITAPVFAYSHSADVVSGETCPRAGSSLTGIAFYPQAGGSFPAAYEGGLFFADHSRNCIWYIPEGAGGQPDTGAREVFVEGAANPVDLVVGPAGDLFYVDFEGGTIRRIRPNGPPVADIDADPTSGSVPLTVDFDGSGSTDPDGSALTYEWDLDGDGAFDDATGATAQHTYVAPGNITAGLKVTDTGLATDTASQLISAGNDPPVPVILTPSAGLTWKVGDQIPFSGSATDPQDGVLPPSALSWSLAIRHCPSGCHSHPIQSWRGVATGSFDAPDHSYPSHLELTLTATDSFGTQRSVTRQLNPKTVVLTFHASAPGLKLAVNASASTAPFTRTVIVGSSNSVSASSPQTVPGGTYVFDSWAHGRAQSHQLVAPASNTTYTARYDPTLLTIAASADAQVRSAHPDRNYGTTTNLRVRPGKSRVYVKFEVAGLSGRPTSAKLRLWVTNPSPNGGRVYRVSRRWRQIDITWRNAPNLPSSPLDYLSPAPAGTWVEFDVTSAIAGNGKVAFAISGGTSDAVDYASRETTHDPMLFLIP